MLEIESKNNNLFKEIKKLKEKKITEFSDLMMECECKLECVVTFLALLELMKQRMVKVYQTGSFGEILIERNEEEVE